MRIALKETADRCYDVYLVEVKIDGGLERRFYDGSLQSGPYGELNLEVPLYSVTGKLRMEEKRTKYLTQGYAQIKHYALARSKVKVLREKVRVVKRAMLQEGLAGIDAFYQIKLDLAEAKAEMEEAYATVYAYIEQCK